MAAAGRTLGLGLGSLANLLSPEIIVIGGGLTALGRVYLDPAREAVAEDSYVQRLRPASIEVARFQDTGGVIGAAAAAFEAVRRNSPRSAQAGR